MLLRDLTEIIRILDKAQAILENITFICQVILTGMAYHLISFHSEIFKSPTERKGLSKI